jgi:hypothetical protein
MPEFNLKFEVGQPLPQEVKDNIVDLLAQLRELEKKQLQTSQVEKSLAARPTWYFAYKTD